MRALDGSLRRVYLALLLWGTGFGLYNYLWPNYATALGANGVDLGLLFALTALVTTVVAVPGGWLADRCDRRRVILAGWWLAVPSAALWAVARDWRALIPGVLLYNASNILLPSLQAYVADRAPRERIASVFTLVFSASAVGPVFSPVVGGYIAARWGVPSLFWIAFALFVASGAILHGLQSQRPIAFGGMRRLGRGRPATTPGETPPRIFADPALRSLMVLAAVVIGLDTLAWPFFPALLKQRGGAGDVAIGWYGALVSLSAAAAVPLSGRLAERLGLARVLAWGQGILAGATGLLAAAPGAPAAVIPALALRGALDGSRTLLAAQVGAVVPRESAGRVFGMYGLVTGLAGALTPYLGGWLYQRGPSWPFWTSVPALALVAAAVPLAVNRRRRVSPPLGANPATSQV